MLRSITLFCLFLIAMSVVVGAQARVNMLCNIETTRIDGDFLRSKISYF
jgi:hypothetical protein